MMMNATNEEAKDTQGPVDQEAKSPPREGREGGGKDQTPESVTIAAPRATFSATAPTPRRKRTQGSQLAQ